MHAYRIETIVPQDHRLELTLPSDFPTGATEVIFLAKEDAPPAGTDGEQAPHSKKTLKAFSAWLKQQPATPRSREEVEAQLREERDGWGEA